MGARVVYSPGTVAMYVSGPELDELLASGDMCGRVEIAKEHFPVAAGCLTLNSHALELIKAAHHGWLLTSL